MNKEISNEKIIKFLLQIVYAFLFIILAVIGVMAFIVTAKMDTIYYLDSETMKFTLDNILINIIGVIIFLTALIGGVKITKKLSTKLVLGISLGLLFVMGLAWVLTVNNIVLVRADQEIVYQAAQEFINGNFDRLKIYEYLALYPYQIGFVTFLEILIRVFSGRINPCYENH